MTTETDTAAIEVRGDSALAEARAIPPTSSQIVAVARALEIVDDTTFTLAGHNRAELKTAEQTIISKFRVPKHKLDEAKASLLDLEKEALSPVRTAIGIYDSKLLAEKHRRDREAEEERQRQLAAARAEEETRRLKEAEASVEAGMSQEEALAILEEPVAPVLAPKAATTPKLEGVSYRDNWSAEVIDMRALVAHAHAHPALIPSLLLPNLPDLNKMAKAQKSALAQSIPGVRANNKPIMAGGAR